MNVTVFPKSPEPMVYVGLSTVLLLSNPVPLWVQASVPLAILATVVRVPKSNVGVPSQIASSLPALEIGAGVIVNSIVLFVLVQVPFGRAVNVKVFVPVSPG